MTNIYVATEFDVRTLGNRKYIQFDLDCEHKNGLHPQVSFEMFDMEQRIYFNKMDTTDIKEMYRFATLSEFLSEFRRTQSFINMLSIYEDYDDLIEIIVVKDLWEFFDLIGYDYYPK